jgi:hypothetical protein
MKKLLFAFLFCVAISCKDKLPITPTRVEGVVYDKETNLPIENAVVSIIKSEYYGNGDPALGTKKSLEKTSKDGSFSGCTFLRENRDSKENYREGWLNYYVTATADGYQKITQFWEERFLGDNYIVSINEGKKNKNLKIELIKNRNVKFHLIDKEPLTNVNQVKIGIEEFYIDQGSSKMRNWGVGIFTKDISGTNDFISFVFKDRRYRFNFNFYHNGVFVTRPVNFTEFDVNKDIEMEIYY